jgi:serine/threonine protein kinase
VCTARMNPRWLAPEVLEGLSYSSKIDIYAFGVIIWEMITRANYMEDRFLFVIQDKILKGIRPDIPESCPKRLLELIKLCWNGKPEIRPDINSCIDILSAEIGEQFPSLLEIAVLETPVQPILKPKKGGVRSRSADMDFVPRATTSSSSSDLSDGKQLRPVKIITHLEQGAIQCMLYVERLNQVWIGDGSGRILVYNEVCFHSSYFSLHPLIPFTSSFFPVIFTNPGFSCLDSLASSSTPNLVMRKEWLGS